MSAIGEAGSITTNSPTENAPINVTFDQPLTDPIIVMTGTNNGGNAYTLRITDIQLDANGDATGFTFIIEEWEYLDGPHGVTETFNFLAIEEGVHTLPDGRIIEAGTTTATSAESTVTLDGDFDEAPVVLTSVMSENDTTTVDSDAWDIDADGFTVSLQEEEAEDDNHASETVGYIAVEGGIGAIVQSGIDENTDTVDLGGTFTTAISVADTQTMNGTDPGTIIIDGGNGTDEIDLYFQEEQSDNTEVNHLNEDVGVITFEDGLILCFTDTTLIDTPAGPRQITDLARGDLILTKDAGPQPIQVIADTTIAAPTHDMRPIVIRANAIAPGVPAMDLTVSPQHRVLLDSWKAQLMFGEEELLVPAKALINDSTILRATSPAPVRYIHLGLDAHHLVMSNGMATETLHAGDISKSAISDQAREDLFGAFPDLRTMPDAWGPAARSSLSVKEGRVLAM